MGFSLIGKQGNETMSRVPVSPKICSLVLIQCTGSLLAVWNLSLWSRLLHCHVVCFCNFQINCYQSFNQSYLLIDRGLNHNASAICFWIQTEINNLKTSCPTVSLSVHKTILRKVEGASTRKKALLWIHHGKPINVKWFLCWIGQWVGDISMCSIICSVLLQINLPL